MMLTAGVQEGHGSSVQHSPKQQKLCCASRRGFGEVLRNSSPQINEEKEKMLALKTWTVQSYVTSRVRAGHVQVSGQSMIYAFVFEK